MLNRPTDWIALAYEQAMDIETNSFKMWAEFAAAMMGARKPGSGTPGIENRPPTAQELKSMGLSRRK